MTPSEPVNRPAVALLFLLQLTVLAFVQRVNRQRAHPTLLGNTKRAGRKFICDKT
jgi:hypothetical protein